MTPRHALRKLRKENDISQEYIARKLGIHQSAYSRFENGCTRLYEERIQALALFLTSP